MNKQIESHEYNLRLIVDITTRYQINALYTFIDSKHPYSYITNEVNHLREYFEDFRKGLNDELSKVNNWKAIETDIKSRFFPTIKNYFNWYHKHKDELKIFEPNNFFELVFENMISTQDEINKYFEGLTFIKLKEYEFSPEQIEQLLTFDNIEFPLQNNKGFFYASNIEGKIYSGIEAKKKVYFKDKQNPNFPFLELSLVPDYYTLIETAYIKQQQQIAGSIFNEQAAKERFRLNEIESTKEKIHYHIDKYKHLEKKPSFALNTIEKFTHYLQYLHDLKDKPSKTVGINEAPVSEFNPSKFSELFINPTIVNDCINLLRETDKPCINEVNEFIRNKGAFVVWFNTLEQKKVFNYSYTNDIERAETLNYNFEGLNVSDSLFRQGNKRAKDNYKTYFETEISAIKR